MTSTKTPTGMQDNDQFEVAIVDKVTSIIKRCYELRCGNSIDTPELELQSTIHDLYGEEFNKLVYNIEDFGGEKLMLRYDLTVPFIRYAADNSINAFRRMQLGTVYRRDNPQLKGGRYRRFRQYDFDILGDDQDTCIYDIEVLDLLNDVMTQLLGDKFIVRLNHRKIIYNLLKLSNIPLEKYETVASSLDKLDKCTWDEIKNELLTKKAISQESVDILVKYIEMINTIDYKKASMETTIKKLHEMKICDDETYTELTKSSQFFNTSKNYIFDPFVVRGMNYYTGIIFEVSYTDSNIISSTIAAGGRYDDTIEKLGNHNKVRAIGMSIGIERICTIYKETIYKNEKPIVNNIEYYVASIGKSEAVLKERINTCLQLRKLNKVCMMSNHRAPKMAHQFEYVFKNKVKYMIIIGDCEIAANQIRLKIIDKNKEVVFDKDKFYDMVKDHVDFFQGNPNA
jgi:histidyl-tRNA synthetase